MGNMMMMMMTVAISDCQLKFNNLASAALFYSRASVMGHEKKPAGLLL
jgi:hypothetical protein